MSPASHAAATRLTTLRGSDSSYPLSFSVLRCLLKPRMRVPKGPFAFSLALLSPRASSVPTASRIRFFYSALSISTYSSSCCGSFDEEHRLLKSGRRRRRGFVESELLLYSRIALSYRDLLRSRTNVVSCICYL